MSLLPQAGLEPGLLLVEPPEELRLWSVPTGPSEAPPHSLRHGLELGGATLSKWCALLGAEAQWPLPHGGVTQAAP